MGNPIFVDKVTKKLEPMNFARVSIEITPSSALPSSLDVVVIEQESNSEKVVLVRVEYQNRPQTCSHCKSFGHSLVRCPSANYKWVPKGQVVEDPVPPDPVSRSDSPSVIILKPLNDWTLVSKGPKQQTLVDLSAPVGHAINSFKSLASLGGSHDFSDTHCTPSPNPLVGRLKAIDEKAGRELKSKARGGLEVGPSSKKKSKGGGGGKSPT